jgi:hypothetical protein
MISFSRIVRRECDSLAKCRSPWGSPGSPIPLLAALSLHRGAGRIPDLHPDPTGTRLTGAVGALRDDAFSAKPAGMFEHRRAIPDDLFVEHDACLGIAQQSRQRGLTVEEREIAEILAIVLGSGRTHRGSPYARPLVDAGPQIGTSRWAHHNRLAVEREALGGDRGDRGWATVAARGCRCEGPLLTRDEAQSCPSRAFAPKPGW